MHKLSQCQLHMDSIPDSRGDQIGLDGDESVDAIEAEVWIAKPTLSYIS